MTSEGGGYSKKAPGGEPGKEESCRVLPRPAGSVFAGVSGVLKNVASAAKTRRGRLKKRPRKAEQCLLLAAGATL